MAIKSESTTTNKTGAVMPNGVVVTNVYEAWQAAKAECEKEIAELQAKIEIYASNANHAIEIYAKDAETIAELKARALEESNKYVAYCDLAESKIAELKAHNNVLREALEFIVYTEPTLVIHPQPNMEVPTDFKQFTTTHKLTAKKALATTPAQRILRIKKR